MKKSLLVMLLAVLAFPGFAQLSQQGTSIVSLSTGRAIAGGVRMNDTTLHMNQKNGQVFSLSYDHMITDRFSLGFLVANQVINLKVNDTLPGGGDLLVEQGKVNRLYAGVQGRWHYGKGEHVRFYSGFRMGYVMFSSFGVKTENGRPSQIEEDNNRTRFSLGITPIGMNVFLRDNLAFHVETSIGAPSMFLMGANFRF